ncbi:MAG TPA: error-prone DNA polymerase [Rhodocyclaceae bacterium]|nr:error-prone DNA polymerase [Rhodocyclaceae bacterium]HMV52746.1 error-prone DNA polymerase [Rhodocyclaceae bacterium]HNB78230.1 error-prone DNA polymerase [Rhodocyclaceae bacterium]HNC60325.1 error-prone DNA polymerase [Rhodocyclaceae bacterium]HNH12025.1 error-prone DNA polymerase [Rhodocyclaceae bacterium]
MLPAYAELHCLSNFSFLRGASHPEELVERAAQAGYQALAITDECSLAGAVRAHLAARQAGLPLIVGSELQLARADGTPDLKLVLLPTNRNGYGDLAELITFGRRNAVKGCYRLTRADLDAGGLDDCLALLVPCRAASRVQAPQAMADLLADANWLAVRFASRAWLAVELHRDADDAAWLAALQGVACATGLPILASGDVHMHVRTRRRLQDVLTATRLRTTLDEAGRELFRNGERHLRSRAVLAKLYPCELLDETLRVAERCRFSLDELRYEYPEELVPSGETPTSWLRRLTTKGFYRRFGTPLAPLASPGECDQGELHHMGPILGQHAPEVDQARTLVEHELALIAELAYEPYFLTVHDIVAWARAHNILCQGRGSAANSAVCYCLGITEVDPSRMSMLFERFISKERNEPPDIDVDFEHERREEVIQYIYAKYGRERAALAAALITYRPKSALRDIGRALGFDSDRLNQLTRNLAWWDRDVNLPERLQEAGFNPESPRVALMLELTRTLIGFPRHLSQHTGGFVIARGKLSRLVPIENAAMAERTVIEWDKDDLDALGLLKIDVLALGMLTAIRKTLDCVNAWRDTPGVHAGGANGAGSTDSTGNERGAARLTVSDIPPEDPAVYEMLCRGDSVGVFQVESRAQMTMLPRLQPRRYYDLVIEVAIVRPGPIQGGMVHPYLRRRQKVEPVSYPSPEVEGVLERTLGVPIFQEQVMQLSIVAAGFTPGEADRLRRAMAAWRRKGGLEPFEMKLVDGMRARGYDEAFARQIFQQILGFGEYGFPESHAASFALLVYVSAWLKHHHPAAFLCGLLNSLPMGFYAPAQLIQDARRHGVTVLPVDVMVSGRGCVLEAATGSGVAPGPSASARLGLSMVDGLGEPATQRIVAARAVRPFDGIEDLARRATLDAREMRLLASAGALAALAGHRHHALWLAAGSQPPPSLLHASQIADSALELTAPSEGENLVADYRAMGFTLGRHPLALLRRHLARMRFETSQEINEAPHRKLARAAGVVTCRQRPGTASGVVFVTMEDETGTTNVIVHADLVERQRRELLASRLMGVYGQVQREGRVVHLIAKRLVDVSHLLGRLATHSRDFH